MNLATNRRDNGTPSRPEESVLPCSNGWRNEFDGNPEKLRRAATAALSRNLQVDIAAWSPLEQAAFENFASILSLAPEVRQWTNLQKQAMVNIIRAKVSADEREYLRLLQQHRGLKEIVLRLGSERPRSTARTA